MKNTKTGSYAIVKHTYTTLGGGSVGLVEGAEGVDPHEGLGIFRPNDDYGAVALSDFLNGPVRAWNKAEWKPSKKKLTPLAVHDWYFSGLLDVGGNYRTRSPRPTWWPRKTSCPSSAGGRTPTRRRRNLMSA